MLKRSIALLLVCVLVVSIAGLAKKPEWAKGTGGPDPVVAELKIELEAAKAQAKIDSTIATSRTEIQNALTLAEMLERAEHNDRKVARIIARFERSYGPVDASPFYIEVYNAYVEATVLIDPIHICGQGVGRVK